MSFAVRELGELAVLQFASKRAGSFQCRESGELVINSVAGEAGRQCTVSGVMRAGSHSVEVNVSRYVGSVAVEASWYFCS